MFIRPFIIVDMLFYRGQIYCQMSQEGKNESEKKLERKPDPVRFKAVIIGESNVGKTSLVQRLITGTFSHNLESTIGVSNSKKVFETSTNGPVELCIWDTAGQEIFHSLVPLYSRSASVCVLVCSVDVEKSVDSIQQWVHTIRESCDPVPPIILALNKIDLADENDEILTKIRKTYPNTFVNEFSCSALTGEGVEELFLCAALHACKANGMKVPEDQISTSAKKSSCC